MINIPFLRSPKLHLASDKIEHGFFTRKGGNSKDNYESLNCSVFSEDNKETVEENLIKVRNSFSFKPKKLILGKQVHGKNVMVIDDAFPEGRLPECDALVTRESHILLGILTADCAPILLADIKNDIIGACHAGWRGAKEGIIEETISVMQSLGAEKEWIIAAIGPCIHQNSYEVDEKFYQEFNVHNYESSLYFKQQNKKYFFNLPKYCAYKLNDILDIDLLDFDTYAQEKLFFSHRKSTHNKQTSTGRQISIIGLNS